MESMTQKGLYLFRLFFKAMMFAFTSGMAAIPTIERGIVDKKKWLTHEEFWTYPVLGQSLPGVISIHNAILIGNSIAGPFGAFMALLGVITPPFVCMLGIAMVFQTFVDNPYIHGMIRGIRIISVAILLGNGIRLLSTVHRDAFSIIIVIVAIVLPLVFNLSAFWTIIMCGTAGIISILADPSVLNHDGSEKQGKTG
jgi:chromate transporter